MQNNQAFIATLKNIRPIEDADKIVQADVTLNDVIVTSSKVVTAPKVSGITIPCAQKTWLEVTSLIAPSGREMSGQDFLRGYAK